MFVRSSVEQVCEDRSSDEATCCVSRRGAQPRATRRGPDRDETEPGYRPGLELEPICPHLLAVALRAANPHNYTQAGIQNPMKPGNRTPLVRVSALHGVSGPTQKCKAGSHLGSTLKPGGAVLTLGVSRRSGSVACIHVDASPNEVLTPSMMHEHSAEVNSPR
jgi:hypothetical protein